MTTVVAGRYDPHTSLAFYTAVSAVPLPNSPFESATEIDYSYTDGTTDYTLTFLGTDFTFSHRIPTGGTITQVSATEAPADNLGAVSTDFTLSDLNVDGSGGLPISTVIGWVLNKDVQGAFDALFAGDDTFDVVYPGPNVIDGGPGANTAVFNANFADATVTFNGDGSLNVGAGTTTAVLRDIQTLRFNDLTLTPGQIATLHADYQTLLGRAPSQGEVGFWAGQLQGGVSNTAIEAALINAQGNLRPIALIDTLYQSNFGATPSAQEYQFWYGQLSSGAVSFESFASQIDGAAAVDPASQAQSGAEIVDGVYELFFGRAAAQPERDYWVGRLQTGQATLGDLQSLLASTPAYTPASLDQGITNAYEQLVGRDPTHDELTSLEQAFASGSLVGTLGTLRYVLQTSPEGQGRLSADVEQIYQSIGGRAASADELRYWTGRLQDGLTVDGLRETLVHAPNFLTNPTGGQDHTQQIVDSVYKDFLGREPTAAELTEGSTKLLTGVDDVGQLQREIIAGADPTVPSDHIATLYEEYLGVAPAPNETAFWSGVLSSGQGTLGDLRGVLLATPAGQAHIGPEVAALYQNYAGLTADAATQGFWTDQINSGAYSYERLADLLATITTDGFHSQHVDLTGTDGTLTLSGTSFRHVVLEHFDPAHGVITFNSGGSLPPATFDGFHPLEHAVQVGDPLGSGADVLISFDPADTLLIKGVTLAQLHASDFLVNA